jgi:hypothetical protein
VEGADLVMARAAPGTVTVIAFEVPVIEAVMVSVTVIVWEPGVFSVAVNVPTPFVSETSLAGNVAAVSVLLKFTVPV